MVPHVYTRAPVQARAGAAHVQALKAQRMKVAAEAGRAPAPHEENVLTHWVRSAADMRLKVCAPPLCYHQVAATISHIT